MKEKYITGKHALNIHPKDCYTVGDWHEGVWTHIKVFPSEYITMGGLLYKYNTLKIWDEYGIYEGREYIENLGIKCFDDNIYIANHKRAILDMLYMYLKEFGMIWEIEDASWQFIANIENIKEMLEMSKKIINYLSEKQLIEYYAWYENEKKALKGKYKWN